jgi:hypothetical protein
VLGPLLTRLESGASVDEVDVFLKRELVKHFGVFTNES